MMMGWTFVDPMGLAPALWLKADGVLWQDSARTTPATDDAHPVGAWDDASGNGKHALQATAGKRLTLKLNIQNGKPVLRFDGVDDYLSIASIATFPAKRGTIFAVTQNTAAASENVILSTYPNTPSGWEWFGSTHANFRPYGWYDAVGSVRIEADSTVSVWSVHTVIRSADTVLEYRRNGVARAGRTIDDNQPGTGALAVGAVTGGGGYFNGDMMEILVFNTLLTAGKIAAIENYLNARAGAF